MFMLQLRLALILHKNYQDNLIHYVWQNVRLKCLGSQQRNATCTLINTIIAIMFEF